MMLKFNTVFQGVAFGSLVADDETWGHSGTAWHIDISGKRAFRSSHLHFFDRKSCGCKKRSLSSSNSILIDSLFICQFQDLGKAVSNDAEAIGSLRPCFFGTYWLLSGIHLTRTRCDLPSTHTNLLIAAQKPTLKSSS